MAIASAAPANMVPVLQACSMRSARAGANSSAFIFTLTAALHAKLAASLRGQVCRLSAAAQGAGIADAPVPALGQGDHAERRQHGDTVVEEAQHIEAVHPLGEAQQRQGQGRQCLGADVDCQHHSQCGHVQRSKQGLGSSHGAPGEVL